ncbi:hypothetical protein RF11_00875 [Thelohanellus kitauei]|uniref:Tc1-like transposase DDE domain-containing protein n=1 Tax=Thelohanellus kitauei TaxID=669202 RepID=A0A0C2MTW3_THEKT|nr:hypothetical protein RF11_00875 [Thelohanellus kitauei]
MWYKSCLNCSKYKNQKYFIWAAFNINSVFYYEIRNVPYNTERFSTFINEFLAKLAQAGIANCIIKPGSTAKIDSADHKLLFLPPYSPFLYPIENMFNQWKGHVKSAGPGNETELLDSIKGAMELITPNNCINCYNHIILHFQVSFARPLAANEINCKGLY